MAAFRCKDGYIIIATVGDEHWQRFCRAINRPDWAADPGYRTKRQRWEKKYILQEEIEKWTSQRTVKEVGEIMDRERVANSPILNIQQVVDDPHLKERAYFAEIEHPLIGKAKIPGIPFKLSETPGLVRNANEPLGARNEEVYCGLLGLSREKLKELKDAGVI